MNYFQAPSLGNVGFGVRVGLILVLPPAGDVVLGRLLLPGLSFLFS
jgi:hypothetical protein